MCSGRVDARTARELITSSVEWCLGLARVHLNRAAYTRPTVGQLAEGRSASGGLAGHTTLARAAGRVRACVQVIECDISKLPRRVDMLCVPSNEWLRSPGFGAMEALYQQGGSGLKGWVEAQTLAAREAATDRFSSHGAVLSPGEVCISPAYGTIRAAHLCHAVGIAFYEAARFHQACTSGNEEERQKADAALLAAAVQQVHLIRAIFWEAARVGARSIAIPAVSAGKRGFPPLLAAAITLSVATHEVLASGGDLEVMVVTFGDENHLDAFKEAREAATTRLVELQLG